MSHINEYQQGDSVDTTILKQKISQLEKKNHELMNANFELNKANIELDNKIEDLYEELNYYRELDDRAVV